MTLEVTVGQEVSAADGALARGAKIVADSKVALNSELSSLRGKLSSIGSMWQGSGATAFTSVMQQWENNANRIVSSLDNFEENLKQSQTTYTATDDAATQAMNRLQGRLG